MKASVSILLPTRGRPAFARRCLESMGRTAQQPSDLEVVLRLDEDDDQSHTIEVPGLRIVRLIGPRSTMGVMTKECFEAASGELMMLCNDDLLFRTQSWDQAVRDAFGRYPDGIALVWANDRLRGGTMATHPFLSRRFCELVGGPCPSVYIHDYIDLHLFDIFRRLERAGHRRLVYLPEVVIEHCCLDGESAGRVPAEGKRQSASDQRTYLLWAEERERIARELACAAAAAVRET